MKQKYTCGFNRRATLSQGPFAHVYHSSLPTPTNKQTHTHTQRERKPSAATPFTAQRLQPNHGLKLKETISGYLPISTDLFTVLLLPGMPFPHLCAFRKYLLNKKVKELDSNCE